MANEPEAPAAEAPVEETPAEAEQPAEDAAMGEQAKPKPRKAKAETQAVYATARISHRPHPIEVGERVDTRLPAELLDALIARGEASRAQPES